MKPAGIHKRIAVLPGDGVGPEVVREAVSVLRAIEKRFGHSFEFSEHVIGGAAIRLRDTPLPKETLDAALSSDAVLLGAVGASEFDHLPSAKRPEGGLLELRKRMNTYANLRPVRSYPALSQFSPLRSEKAVDFLIVRELTGGLYFGEPRYKKLNPQGERFAVNTLIYSEHEISRVARMAFEAARARRCKVTSVDKANVLETSQLWREIVCETSKVYPDVELEHLYVDNCAMQLILNPQRFDVVLTENLFGDILSDEAAVLSGSLGLLPSASLGETRGLYEPVHGSAPDLAGRNQANPVGAILSAAMLLRHSFRLENEAAAIEQAVNQALEEGIRTADIAGNQAGVSTAEFGETVCKHVL